MLRFIFLSVLFFFHIAVCHRSSAQNQKEKTVVVLDKRMTEKFNNISAREALKIISEKSQVNFCYNSGSLSVDFLVDLTLVNKTIEEALRLIFQKTSIQTIYLGDHVVIKKVKNEITNVKDSSTVNLISAPTFIEPSSNSIYKSEKVQKLSKEYKQYLKNNYDIIFRADISSDSLEKKFTSERNMASKEKVYIPKTSRQKWFIQAAFKKPLMNASLDFENSVPITTVNIVSQNYKFQSKSGGEVALGYYFSKRIFGSVGFQFSRASQELVDVYHTGIFTSNAPPKFNLEVKTQNVKTNLYSLPLELGYTYKFKRFGISLFTGIHFFITLNKAENLKLLYVDQKLYPNEEYTKQNPEWFFNGTPPNSNDFTKTIYAFEQEIDAKSNYALVGGLALQYYFTRRLSLLANIRGYYFLKEYSSAAPININFQMQSGSLGLQYSW